MGLRISSVPIPPCEALRELVIKSLPTLVASYRILDSAMPVSGSPILVIEENTQPVVLSFDAENAGAALMSGLTALGKLQTYGRWLSHLYPECPEEVSVDSARLLVLAPSPLSGAEFLASPRSVISFYIFRTLRIDDELSLLVEPLKQVSRQEESLSAEIPLPTAHYVAERNPRITLTTAEEIFFG